MNYEFSLGAIPLPADFSACEISVPTPSRSLSIAMRMAADLRLSMAKREPVAERRQPAEGDLAVLDIFSTCGWRPVPGMCVDGLPFRPGVPSGLPREAEDQALLMYEGDTAEITVTCPENHPDESLRGRKIVMRITLRRLLAEELPEVNDEFAKKFGCETVNDMEEMLMKRAVAEEAAAIRMSCEQALLDKLVSEAGFTPPSSEVERFLAAGIRVRRMEMANSRIPGEKAEEMLREMLPELRSAAEARAKAHVFLLAAASRENITVTEQELADGIARMAAGSRGDPEELRKSIMSGPAAAELREKMLAGKTLAHIYDKARKIPAPAAEA